MEAMISPNTIYEGKGPYPDRTTDRRMLATGKSGPAFDAPTSAQVALGAAGDLMQHLQRGCVQDAVSAYEGLLDCVGVAPMLPLPVRIPGLPADGAARAVSAALANCYASDARRHWYDLHCVMFTIVVARLDILNRLLADVEHETDYDAIEDGRTDVPVVTRERDRLANYVMRMGVR